MWSVAACIVLVGPWHPRGLGAVAGWLSGLEGACCIQRINVTAHGRQITSCRRVRTSYHAVDPEAEARTDDAFCMRDPNGGVSTLGWSTTLKTQKKDELSLRIVVACGKIAMTKHFSV